MVDINLTGVFLCTQEAIRIMKDQYAARRPHHQQRFDLGARAAPELRAVHGDQARRSPGSTKSTSLDGRKYDIACSQIDIGNAHTDLAARMANGVPQANGQIAVEPLMDVAHVASAVRLHGEPAARRERAVHDHHGDEDAVRRQRLVSTPPKQRFAPPPPWGRPARGRPFAGHCAVGLNAMRASGNSCAPVASIGRQRA